MARIGRALPSHVLLSHGLTAQQLILILEGGGYEIVGQPSTNILAISATSGSYSLTGSEPTLEHPVTFSAESGGYVLTGDDRLLPYGRRFASDEGVYVMTGIDGTLVYGQLGGETTHLLAIMGMGG